MFPRRQMHCHLLLAGLALDLSEPVREEEAVGEFSGREVTMPFDRPRNYKWWSLGVLLSSLWLVSRYIFCSAV